MPRVEPKPPGPKGSGDQRVQAYNFRVCLTDVPANRVPLTRPPGYNPLEYELLARHIAALHGQSILADAGLGPAVTQPLRDAWLARRPASDLVTEEMIDTLAVAGTPEQCHRALSRLAEAGLDVPVAFLPPGPPVSEQLTQLHDALAPAWKEMVA